MSDLRQILSQGRKRIGLLVGAGAPMSIRDESNHPLISDIATLTKEVITSLEKADQKVVLSLLTEIGNESNIEQILTRVRLLSRSIYQSKIHGLDGNGYDHLSLKICAEIGQRVSASLPLNDNPYSNLISWIAGTHRDNPVEIFTSNYDLLFEEAFEKVRLPYFDGFTGSHCPFFDPVSISNDQLPARWSRLWKLHGSLGWDFKNGTFIRTGSREATNLIYPDHLKYDAITKLPYSALFDRLREFLITPDSLLICSGFSFSDAHICAVLDEALAENSHMAIFAFQYNNLEDESFATKIALRRPNLSIYARDGAVVCGIPGKWQISSSFNEEWHEIRKTFWGTNTAEFLLGDFAQLARFFALAQAQQMQSTKTIEANATNNLPLEEILENA